ncbi:hypothetical protein [Micromonospora sp. NPDC049679]|uniref:hypothetical protein n=1 Tax=Micromonospora sp. NPDC049679 TaxID=3155920 RepID=UPI0033E4CFFB
MRSSSGFRVTAMLCALLLAGAACTGNKGKGDDVDIRSEADVTRQVQQYAEQTATAVGSTLTNAAASSAPCEGRAGELSEDIYYVQGTYQLPLAPDKHLATLARIRDQWRGQGYTITEDRTFPDSAEGTVAAKTPTDGYRISLESTSPPTMLALLIHSDCYRSPQPR